MIKDTNVPNLSSWNACGVASAKRNVIFCILFNEFARSRPPREIAARKPKRKAHRLRTDVVGLLCELGDEMQEGLCTYVRQEGAKKFRGQAVGDAKEAKTAACARLAWYRLEWCTGVIFNFAPAVFKGKKKTSAAVATIKYADGNEGTLFVDRPSFWNAKRSGGWRMHVADEEDEVD